LGAVELPRYLGESIRPGDAIEGPAAVDEATSTLVLYPGSRMQVTNSHSYLVEIEL